MLTEPLIQQLHTLRLKGMATALEQQHTAPDLTDRSFEDRLGLMIQHELIERAGYRLAQRLRWAKLPMPACVEDLDTRAPRGLDPAQLAQVIDLALDPRAPERAHHRTDRRRQELSRRRARACRLPRRLLGALLSAAATHR